MRHFSITWLKIRIFRRKHRLRLIVFLALNDFPTLKTARICHTSMRSTVRFFVPGHHWGSTYPILSLKTITTKVIICPKVSYLVFEYSSLFKIFNRNFGNSKYMVCWLSFNPSQCFYWYESVRAITHDESLYPDPYTFKPERFLDSNGELNSDDRVLAYGFGRRFVYQVCFLSYCLHFCYRLCVGQHVASSTVGSLLVSGYLLLIDIH